jgi:hypothetical protein
MKEGTTPIEDTHRSEGNLDGFYSNLLHSYSRTLIYNLRVFPHHFEVIY